VSVAALPPGAGGLDVAALLAGAVLAPVAAAAASEVIADAAADVASTAGAAAAAQRGKPRLALPSPALVARAAASDAAAARTLDDAADAWIRRTRATLAAADAGSQTCAPAAGLKAEADHWAAAAAVAASLAQQLVSPEVQAVRAALVAARSPAAHAVGRAAADAAARAADAADAALFAKALLPVADTIAAAADMGELAAAALSLWRCLSTVFARSAHYASPARAERLLRLAVDAAVARVLELVSGAGLAAAPPADAAAAARSVLAAVAAVKAPFFEARTASRAVSSSCYPRGWPFDPAAVFAGADAVAARAAAAADAFAAAAAYANVETVVIGGAAGRALTAAARGAAADARAAAVALAAAAGDALDPADPAFDAASAPLRDLLPELDRRLAAVVARAVAPSGDGLDTALRAGECLDAALDRRAAQSALSRVAPALWRALEGAAGDAISTLAAAAAAPPLPRGAPPAAGAVAWARAMRDTLAGLATRTTALSGSVGSSPASSTDAARAAAAADRALAALGAHESGVLAAWHMAAVSVADSALEAPVLARGEGGGWHANVSPALDALLRDAAAMQALSGAPVELPLSVATVHAAGDDVRRAAAALDAAAARAASLAAAVAPAVAPLLAPRLASVDAALARGVSAVTWASGGAGEFAGALAAAVDRAAAAAAALATPLDRAAALHAAWAHTPLLDRRDGRSLAPADLAALADAGLAARRAAVAAEVKTSATLVTAAKAELGTDAPDGVWPAYEAAVAAALAAAAGAVATGAARSLVAALDPPEGSSSPPLFDVAVDLARGAPAFWPALATQAAASPPAATRATADGRRSSIDAAARRRSTVRLEGGGRSTRDRAAPVGPTSLAAGLDAWIDALAHDATSQGYMCGPEWEATATAARSALARAEARAVAAAAPYAKAASVVKMDANAALKAFLTTGLDGRYPPLTDFEAELARAAADAEAADALPPAMSVPPMRLDGRPLRQAVVAGVARWSQALTDHLAAGVAASLADQAAWSGQAANVLADGAADVDVDALLAPAGARSRASWSRRPTADAGPRRPTLDTGLRRPTGDATAKGSSRRPTGEAPGSRRATADRGAPAPPLLPADPAKVQAAAAATAALYAATCTARDVAERAAAASAAVAAAEAAAAMLSRAGAPLPAATEAALAAAPTTWRALTKQATARRDDLAPRRAAEAARLARAADALVRDLRRFLERVLDARLADAPAGERLELKHARAALAAIQALAGGPARGGENDPAPPAGEPTLADLEAAADALRSKQALMDVFPFEVAPIAAVKVGQEREIEGEGGARASKPHPPSPPLHTRST
jgi:hypothetical protein